MSLDLSRYLLDDLPCGIVLSESNGTLIGVNKTFCHWLDSTKEELLAKGRFQNLLSVGSKLFHYTHWSPLLTMQGSVREIQLDLVDDNGQKIPILANASRIRDGDQELDHIALFLVKDRKLYEAEILKARRDAERAAEQHRKAELKLDALNERLRTADKRKDEFIATLAHELRNPLVPIRNIIELIQHEGLEAEEEKKLISMLRRQMKQITHLVDDLLDSSRVSRGDINLKQDTFLLKTVIDDAIRLAKPAIETKEHRLTVELPSGQITCQADQTRLTQIFLNLLTNAAKYTEKGGTITFKAAILDGQLQVIVEDNGIGIEPADCETIFDMFSQLHYGKEHAAQGLGIGLSLVKKLVELHKGHIRAFSSGRGKGSRFILHLPILRDAKPVLKTIVTKATPTREPANERTILLIDDNEDAAITTAKLLRLQGARVELAHTGQHGIQVWKELSPDIVLLDIGLPDISGYEVARAIRRDEQDTSTPTEIVALTGWGQAEDRQQAFDAGCNAHLTKPVSLDQLKEFV